MGPQWFPQGSDTQKTPWALPLQAPSPTEDLDPSPLHKEPCAHIGVWEHVSRSWLPRG